MPPAFRLIALVCVMLIGVAGWFMMRETSPPEPPAGAAAEARLDVRLADEAEILAHEAQSVSVFRFASNRRVWVLDFASLLEQGRTLNRAAAFLEKAGQPRDRVLTDQELAQAIAAAGATAETYYFGHDYAVRDLARFFAIADRDRVALQPQEEWLRRLLRQEGLLDSQARAAVISIPHVRAGHGIDAAMRAAILRHELSHAEYFTNAAYADHARRFWRDELDEPGRAAFRGYLASEGYDAANEELMVNEMQAYLMHTTDPRFFNAATLGVAPDVVGRWQASFLLGMPNGWLRDACIASLPTAGSAVLRRPRRQAHPPRRGAAAQLGVRARRSRVRVA